MTHLGGDTQKLIRLPRSLQTIEQIMQRTFSPVSSPRAERRVSVMVPYYNEVESIPHLFKTLLPVLEGLGRPFEIIAIDDGSVDGSVGTPVGSRR